MKDEGVITAVYEAAVEDIEDLDIAVGLEDKEIFIDISLVTDRGVDVDQKTADEAIHVASEKADELLENR